MGVQVLCLRRLLFIFATLAWMTGSALAAKTAFVVGIDTYDNLGKERQLERAVSDADAIASKLQSLGFQVTQVRNATRSAFNAAWSKFVYDVLPGDEVAIFFAGHGVEIDGQNYLLPRDIPNITYGREARLRRESLSLSELLADLKRRQPQVSLVILDACRDHPLVPPELRSVSGGQGGLAALLPPQGTFIMYSAGAGETALDRLPGETGPGNSLYTRTLLPLLGQPGLTVQDVAQRVRAEVYRTARKLPHTQRPAYYDGLIGKYCLVDCTSGTSVASADQTDRAGRDTAALAPRGRVGQRRASVVTEALDGEGKGIVIGRRLTQRVAVKVGTRLTSERGSDFAEVVRIANRAIVFRVNGGRQFTCRAGDICQFDWRASPLFRISAVADRARGIEPRGEIMPR